MADGYIKQAKSSNWGTPAHILTRFDGYFDPCPFPMPDWDGLAIPWPQWVFVNPPFCDLAEWAKKCVDEHRHGAAHIALLMPARVDTKAFHSHILPNAQIEFIKGRLKFVDLDQSSALPVAAPFPCIIAHFGGLRK
jgi:hypothetical protein